MLAAVGKEAYGMLSLSLGNADSQHKYIAAPAPKTPDMTAVTAGHAGGVSVAEVIRLLGSIGAGIFPRTVSVEDIVGEA